MPWTVLFTQLAYQDLKDLKATTASQVVEFFRENAEGRDNLDHKIFQQKVCAPNLPTYYIVRHEGFCAGLRFSERTKKLTVIFADYKKFNYTNLNNHFDVLSTEKFN